MAFRLRQVFKREDSYTASAPTLGHASEDIELDDTKEKLDALSSDGHSKSGDRPSTGPHVSDPSALTVNELDPSNLLADGSERPIEVCRQFCAFGAVARVLTLLLPSFCPIKHLSPPDRQRLQHSTRLLRRRSFAPHPHRSDVRSGSGLDLYVLQPPCALLGQLTSRACRELITDRLSQVLPLSWDKFSIFVLRVLRYRLSSSSLLRTSSVGFGRQSSLRPASTTSDTWDPSTPPAPSSSTSSTLSGLSSTPAPSTRRNTARGFFIPSSLVPNEALTSLNSLFFLKCPHHVHDRLQLRSGHLGFRCRRS